MCPVWSQRLRLPASWPAARYATGFPSRPRDEGTAEHRITRTYAFQMMAGETISMTKYTVFTDSVRRSGYVLAWAMAEMSEAVEMGLEYWYQRQQEYLAEFWRCSDLDIDGDEETAVAVRVQSLSAASSPPVGMNSVILRKGLSGEGYEAITSGIRRCICSRFSL